MTAETAGSIVPAALRWRHQRSATRPEKGLPLVDVAASIVQAPDGRVLLAERTSRQISAGFWELPGGKIEAGETAQQAAQRELEEEIGITPLSMRPWVAYEHAFPSKRVRLHFYRVGAWEGDPRGLEGQRLTWVDPSIPSVAPILPSNLRVLGALGLPQVYLRVHAGRDVDRKALLTRLPALLATGVSLIQIQDPHAAPDQRIAFAQRINTIARAMRTRVLLTGSAIEALRAGLHGVHSTAQDLRKLTIRPPVQLWAATCQSADDLARAASLGADFAVLSRGDPITSPVRRPHLGWEGLRALTESSPIPVYAEGGMTPDMLMKARQAGAAGIATDFTDASFTGDTHAR
jgi:8-oxo-dGTP diphosphatase